MECPVVTDHDNLAIRLRGQGTPECFRTGVGEYRKSAIPRLIGVTVCGKPHRHAHALLETAGAYQLAIRLCDELTHFE
ncbi:hypothetical protein D9M71_845100 [compost metagenome]